MRQNLYQSRRLAVLGFIHSYRDETGRGPAVRMIAEQLGFGLASVHSYLVVLRAEGMVEWITGKERTLRCTGAGIRQLNK